MLVGFIISGISAQHQKPKMSDSELEKEVELNYVVVTGTGTHQRLKDSPAPVEVITSRDIKRTGITDFQQAMSVLVPSLSFSGGGAMGNYMMMNGLSNKYILVLINGKKMIGDVSNNLDLARIDVSRIKRVEVLNGAASSLYGSDAIAGVINIITDEPKDIMRVSSNSKFEEYGQFTQIVNVDLAKEKFGSYTSFKHDQSDGWQQSRVAYQVNKTTKELETVPTLAQTTNGFHSNIIDQQFTFNPTKNLSFYANGGYYWKLTDRPEYQKDIEGGSKYDIHYESYKFGLGGKYKLNNKSTLSLDFIQDNYNQNYKYILDEADYKAGQYSKTKRQKFYDVEAKGIFKFAKNNTTVFGVDYRSETLDRPSANVDKSLYTMSAYGQHEIKFLDHFTAIGGLRYDYHETAKGRMTPKVALMYSLNHFNFRGTYSTGFRAPGLDELYYYLWKGSTITVGNKNLDPEKSNYFSLNAEYKTNRYSFSATGYLNYVDDMITDHSILFSDMPQEEAKRIKDKAKEDFHIPDKDLDKIENYKEYQNLEKGQVRGVNVSAMAYLAYGISINANYAYASARGKDKAGEWGPISRSVRHAATFGANYLKHWDKYQLNVNLNTRLQSKRIQPGHKYGDAPGYGLWNIFTRHTFTGIKYVTLEPGIGINNIFNKVDDRPYGVNYGLLSPGRTVMASLKIQFK